MSNIVRELKESGTVVVADTSSGGRRARSVSLSGDAGIVVGIDFGHTHLRVAVGNLAHRVLAEESAPIDVDVSAAQGFDRAEAMVERLLQQAGFRPDKVIGVGLGVPGPIDVETGALGSTAILPGWTGIAPGRELAERLGMPVHVDNDANLGALGELVWGAGRGLSDLAYIKIASGVGAGLVVNGQIYRGRAAPPVRSGTSPWTRPGRSAAAATAAAWRPSWAPATCSRCSPRPSARTSP